MVDDIEDALDQDIASSGLDAASHQAAGQTKLHAIQNKIGYPDQWRDYSA